MKSIAKKVMIYSMLGLMQVGLFATVASASPKIEEPPRIEKRSAEPQRDWQKVSPQDEKDKKVPPKKHHQKKLPPQAASRDLPNFECKK